MSVLPIALMVGNNLMERYNVIPRINIVLILTLLFYSKLMFAN